MREIQGAARRRRRAAARLRRPPLSSGRSAPDGGDPAELSEDLGGRRSVRAVARGSRTLDQEQELFREQGLLQFRLRLSAQHGGDGRQSVRSRAAAPRDAGLYHPPHRRPSRSTARALRPRRSIRKPTRPNSAIQANDQLRPPESRTTAGSHASAGGRSYRAGAAGVRASLLRDGGNRCRGAVGRRGSPPRQGPSQDPDGRHGCRHRGLSQRAHAQCDRAGNRRPQ